MKRISRALLLILVVTLSLTLFAYKSSKPDGNADTSPGEVGSQDAAAAKGDEIEIVSSSTSQDVFGIWHIHALLTNSADYGVGQAELEFVVLDSEGTAVHSETIYVLPYGLTPDEIQPVSIKFPLSVTTVNQFEINVVSLKKVEKESLQLEISPFKLSTADNGIVTLVGEVYNNADQPAVIHSVEAVLFSEDGGMIFTASCEVCARYLDAGESSPISFIIYGQSPDPALDHYEIYISSEAAIPAETFSVEFLELVHIYTDAAGGFHLLGDLQNTGEKILDLNLLGTFFNQAGEIVGVSSASLPMNSLRPGESSPYEIVLLAPLDVVVDWSAQVDLSRSRSVDTPSLELSTQGQLDTPEEFRWTLAGEVVNNSDQDLTMVLVVVGLRETATGKLVGLTHKLEIGEFPTGFTIPYSLGIVPDQSLDLTKLESFVIVRGR
ncbi:MAG: hypothetical protein J7L35_10480 [Anaerolineales bacterium]|nr:hypothetical protein [Anaerolineales bacterium]